MKSTGFFLFALSTALLAISCKRESCHECHYDLNGSLVEIGEYCGDDLASIEAAGFVTVDSTYEVHCEEH